MSDVTTATVLHEEGATWPGAFWRHGLLTPVSAERRTTDAKRITFSIEWVVAIVASVVAIVLCVTGTFWLITSQMRSDIRDVLTRQSDQIRVDELKSKLEDERTEALRQSIAEIKAAQKLEEIRNQEMRVMLAQKGIRP